MVEIVIVVIYVVIRLHYEGQYCQDKADVVESIRPAQYSIHVGTSPQFFLLPHVHCRHVTLGSLTRAATSSRLLESGLESLSLLRREKSLCLSGEYRLQLTELLAVGVRRQRCQENDSQCEEEHAAGAGGGRLSSSHTSPQSGHTGGTASLPELPGRPHHTSLLSTGELNLDLQNSLHQIKHTFQPSTLFFKFLISI